MARLDDLPARREPIGFGAVTRGRAQARRSTHRGSSFLGSFTGFATGWVEVIYADADGYITEGAITNVFVPCGGRLYTPPVRCGLLPGVLREQLPWRGAAEERYLSRRDLASAEQLFVGNSVRRLIECVLDDGDARAANSNEQPGSGQGLDERGRRVR